MEEEEKKEKKRQILRLNETQVLVPRREVVKIQQRFVCLPPATKHKVTVIVKTIHYGSDKLSKSNGMTYTVYTNNLIALICNRVNGH